jgi:hypothetical protein
MRGKATVVRIDPPSGPGIGDRSQGTGIAVQMNTPFQFERVDMKTQGNSSREPPGIFNFIDD